MPDASKGGQPFCEPTPTYGHRSSGWNPRSPPLSSGLWGYSCRQYEEFTRQVFGIRDDTGVPTRLPNYPRVNPREVTNREKRQLLLAAKFLLPIETAFSFRCWLQFLDETAARRGESVIHFEQIDWQRNTVMLRGKTGIRELPLSSQLRRRLAWLLRRHPHAVWCGHRLQPLTAGSLYNIFKAVAHYCGMGDLRPHHFRHRRLTRICRGNLAKNQLLVLAFAGHRHLGSLKPYYHVSIDEKRALLREGINGHHN